MSIKKLLGKNIKDRRIQLQLTQEELAEKIGISPKSLSQIELGKNFVSAENLEAICTALGTSPKVLFDFDNENIDKYEYVIEKLKKNKVLLKKISKIVSIIE